MCIYICIFPIAYCQCDSGCTRLWAHHRRLRGNVGCRLGTGHDHCVVATWCRHHYNVTRTTTCCIRKFDIIDRNKWFI